MKSENDPTKTSLRKFIAKKKFVPEGLYSGVINELLRERCERLVNDLASRLLAKTEASRSQETVMAEFKRTLNEFGLPDTEDRERVATYLEELMDILGIKSSEGLLNKWMYGFDPTQSVESQNADAFVGMTADERAIAKKIESLSPTEVTPFLIQTFGKPSHESEYATMWMDAKARHAISIATQSGKTVLIWSAIGRFTYTRVL